ncbi:MAG: hypothetical protein NZM02_00960, partial [Patescibacteria group bacterium]|nr:hypothetical protein [Patescibacteria group bacterium]
LIWKKHINYDLKISFEYPENLGSSQKKALKVNDGEIILTHNMSYIFKVEKIITNDSVESWWDKNNSSKNNGNGILPAKMTKTKFHNKTAYYFEILANQQVPGDFYIIPFNGYFLKISFIKIKPYRDVLFSCINNNSNLCSISDLYSEIDYDNYYRQFHDLIIQRILSSISFLL